MKTYWLLVAISAQVSVLLADTTITPTVSFGSNSITALQSSGEARIQVNIDGPPLSDFFGTQVSMRSVDGSATWPTDYDSISHSLKFNTADRSKTLIIGIPNTSPFEGVKSFSVRFDTGNSYNIGSPSTVTVNILGSLLPEIEVEYPLNTSLANGSGLLDFGGVAIGTTSIARVVTIRNSGTGTLSGIAVSKVGQNPSAFDLIAPSTTSLAPGGSTSFQVNFKPTAIGSHSATIRIVSNDVDEALFQIDATGNGVTDPEIGVEYPVGTPIQDNSTVLSFGSRTIGIPGASRTLLVRNSGTEILSEVDAVITGTNANDFAITAALPDEIDIGQTGQLTVSFNPTVTGNRSALLLIHSNDGDENPFEVPLVGFAALPSPEIEIEQPVGSDLRDGFSKKAFGTANVGKSGGSKTFTIRNTGTKDLVGISIKKTGDNPADFVVIAPSKTVLPPGASTTFKVTFKPKNRGTRKAGIQIKSNDSNENPFDVKLSGLGIRP